MLLWSFKLARVSFFYLWIRDAWLPSLGHSLFVFKQWKSLNSVFISVKEQRNESIAVSVALLVNKIIMTLQLKPCFAMYYV